jgi:hypothetical protein
MYCISWYCTGIAFNAVTVTYVLWRGGGEGYYTNFNWLTLQVLFEGFNHATMPLACTSVVLACQTWD